MEIKIDSTIQLTDQRVVLFDKYLELQAKFKILADKNILKWFNIEYLQEEKEEVDLDKVTQEQGEELWKLKDDPEKQEKYRKSLPQITRKYYKEMYWLAPFAIWDALVWKFTTLDELSNDTIKLINERIEIKINNYGIYI